MKKYGKLVLMSCDFNTFAIVAEYADQKITLEAGGINLYGVTIKVVRTIEKAIRLAKKYEKRMGRIK